MRTKVEVDVGGTTYEVGSLVEFRSSVEDKLGMHFAEDGELLDELEKRLMPEGAEWPRFDDGDPVWFGCTVMNGDGWWIGHPVDEVIFFADGDVEIAGDGNSMTLGPGDRVRRVVLASDGEPLEAGQTVFDVYEGRAVEVEEVKLDGAVVKFPGGMSGFFASKCLTHERQDSWERVDADLRRIVDAGDSGSGCFVEANSYYSDHDLEGDVFTSVMSDFVRRCKALAERG